MTTSHERRRNLIWGRKALEEHSADSTLPQEWREASAALLCCYPSLALLKGCDDDGLEQLQIDTARALQATKDLFQRMQASPACAEQRKYNLLVILRHFY